MKILALLSICLVLCACRTHHHTQRAQYVIGPDGKPAMVLKCKQFEQCYAVAGQRCPQGYNIITEHEQGPGFFSMDIQQRNIFSLVVSCKE